jgi:uncharacterized protein (DUF697 family)
MSEQKQSRVSIDEQTKNNLIDKLKSEFFSIEKNQSLTIEQKANRVVNYTAGLCSAVAIQPIPFADFFILTPIQGYMGTRLAAIYGINIKEQKAIEIVKQIGGTVGLGLLAQQLAIGAYKTVLPFLGAITTIPLVYGMTYGIGRVMQCYFKARAEGEELTDKEMKKIWKESFKKGKQQGKENEDDIRNSGDVKGNP